MILEHEGITVDFFERFPENQKNIGIHLSGGIDSALILYCLVKMVQERGNDKVSLFPITGYDTGTPNIINYKNAEKIIDWVKNNTKSDIINPLIMIKYTTNKNHIKNDALRTMRMHLRKKHGCTITISGISQGMPNNPREGNDGTTPEKIASLYTKYPYEFPWSQINKKFIAAQYKKFGLEELSLLTNSCIHSSITPCKNCWWCKERYWAFGSYDYGIQ